MYSEVTRDVCVEVESSYIPEQSRPQANYYFFAYHVKITNRGSIPVQLVSRHWVIMDGNGVVHEVSGPGVVGHQPRLAPGETFEYSSFCPLPTPTGNMRGSYHMVPQSSESLQTEEDVQETESLTQSSFESSEGLRLLPSASSQSSPQKLKEENGYDVKIPLFFLRDLRNFH